jgi:hypothetical protein
MSSDSKKPIIVPHVLFEDMIEFLIELSGEWSWKANEPRNNNQSDFRTLQSLIESSVRYRDSDGTLVCDECGLLYPDDEPSSESCENCGRFKQRMDNAKVCVE